MKTSLFDYLLSALAISLILVCSVGPTWAVSALTRQLLGDYHVLLDFVLGLGLYGVASALVMRLLLWWRPIQPGTFGMDTQTFTHWKLVTVIYHLGQAALHPLTPVFFKPLVSALYGAKLGRDVAQGGTIDAPFLISVGDRAVIGAYSLVMGNYTVGDTLVCGRVRIGVGVTIGINAVVFPDVEIGDGATLIGGSFVMPGTRIPAGETWRGNPARKWL